MKSIGIYIGLAICLNVLTLHGQYQNVTIQTPTGVNVDALRFTGTDFTAPEIIAANNYWTNGYNCRILANSTQYYNCHGYAWHNIEGRMGQSDLRWINDVNQYGNPIYNVTKYYSGDNPSYSQITTVYNHLRISYFPRDHSAVTTEDQDSVISKWAWGPLVKHTLAQCPFYSGAQIKYYKLNPIITGSASPLCDDDQRTCTSNLSIPGSTYTWSRETSLLDYISGSGTTSYTVEANGNSGAAYVGLQITTPSGEVRSASNKRFWVGVPPLPVITSSQPYTIYVSGDIILYDENAYNYGGILQNYTDWTWSSDGVCCLYDMTAGYQFYYGAYPGTVRIRTYSENSCGSTYWSEPVYVEVVEEEEFILSPNPAFDVVKVSVSTSKSQTATNESSTLSKYNLDVFDLKGTLYKSFKMSGKEFTFDVSDLREGTYIVKIKIGTKNVSKPLIIKH